MGGEAGGTGELGGEPALRICKILDLGWVFLMPIINRMTMV